MQFKIDFIIAKPSLDHYKDVTKKMVTIALIVFAVSGSKLKTGCLFI